VCGNDACEVGEACVDDACAHGCRADCPLVPEACPVGLTSGPDVPTLAPCAGLGVCVSASGSCRCHAGYGGADCSVCAAGFVRHPTTRGCVVLPGTLRPPPCSDGVRGPGEEGVDCGGVCPQSCASNASDVVRTSSGAGVPPLAFAAAGVGGIAVAAVGVVLAYRKWRKRMLLRRVGRQKPRRRSTRRSSTTRTISVRSSSVAPVGDDDGDTGMDETRAPSAPTTPARGVSRRALQDVASDGEGGGGGGGAGVARRDSTRGLRVTAAAAAAAVMASQRLRHAASQRRHSDVGPRVVRHDEDFDNDDDDDSAAVQCVRRGSLDSGHARLPSRRDVSEPAPARRNSSANADDGGDGGGGGGGNRRDARAMWRVAGRSCVRDAATSAALAASAAAPASTPMLARMATAARGVGTGTVAGTSVANAAAAALWNARAAALAAAVGDAQAGAQAAAMARAVRVAMLGRDIARKQRRVSMSSVMPELRRSGSRDDD
jgi:hypothetical protein